MRAHPDLGSIIGAGVSAAKSVAPRLKVRHRFLARRRIAAIIGRLRDARRDRPKPGRVSAGRVRPHDAADVLVAIDHVIIIV